MGGRTASTDVPPHGAACGSRAIRRDTACLWRRTVIACSGMVCALVEWQLRLMAAAAAAACAPAHVGGPRGCEPPSAAAWLTLTREQMCKSSLC